MNAQLTAILGTMTLVLLIPARSLAQSQTEVAKLTAPDGAPFDFFGGTVSMSGDVAVVGAAGDDANSGSAYVYSFDPDTSSWVPRAKLTASDAAEGDIFARWVAIDGDTVIIGARKNDDAGSDSGSAYVFVRPKGGWTNMTETAKLTASDAAPGDLFGGHVAVNGDVVVLGASQFFNAGRGAAYIFVKPPGGWIDADNTTETVKLIASDSAPDGVFGTRVSVSGDTVVVGDGNDDEAGTNSGASYIFVKPARGWDSMGSPINETAKLIASDAAPGDEFGNSISIDGDTVVAGTFRESDPDSFAGAAYVFVRPPNGWESVPSPITETVELLASDGSLGDIFGLQVSISGDVVVVGATNDDDDDAGIDSGSAYVFVKAPGGWDSMPSPINESVKLLASDGSAGNRFGSVAISGSTMLIGAHLDDDDNGTDSGSAYVFGLMNTPCCPGDLDGDCNVGVKDLLILLGNWGPCVP